MSLFFCALIPSERRKNMFTKILNDEEREMFNKIHEIKSEIVFIKKTNNRYYAKINDSKYFRLKSNIAKLFM